MSAAARQPPALHVLAAGPGTTVQDQGRTGLTGWGVARAGAADRASLRLANRLVGNPEHLAGVECPMGAFSARSDAASVVAVTGARCQVRVDGVEHATDAAVLLPAGARLDVGPAQAGLRAYVALRGGIDVAPVLGSRSRDTLGAVGPEPVVAGMLLPLGAQGEAGPAWFELVPRVAGAAVGVPVVRAVLGPRDDWFTAGSVTDFFRATWTVGTDGNRVGLRLDGPVLARRAGEPASEPMLPGAVQVPGDGRPIVLGPDCGTTGGYPVLAVVVDADLDVFGQLRPGDQVRFRRA